MISYIPQLILKLRRYLLPVHLLTRLLGSSVTSIENTMNSCTRNFKGPADEDGNYNIAVENMAGVCNKSTLIAYLNLQNSSA